jgi:hypothetical protein
MSRKYDGLHRALMVSATVTKALITIGDSFQCCDCLLIIVIVQDGSSCYNDISPIGNNQKTAEFQLNLW